MVLTIKYFGALREQLQCEQELLDGSTGTTVVDIRNMLILNHPGNRSAIEDALCAVNYQYADDKLSVKDGDEIALFPPVTGG